MSYWNELVIDVDYHPCDPGMCHWFCESTTHCKEEIKAGARLGYKDPGGLFGNITVQECDDDKLVLTYGDNAFSLSIGQPYAHLDTGGRDYTEFELNVHLQFLTKIENSKEFFRQFLSKYDVANMTRQDLEQYKASGDPCAKYALGRWHYIMVPEMKDSVLKAWNLFKEAAAEGIADAYEMLSFMKSNGEGEDGIYDPEEAARLRGKALEMGSELAQLRYARNRIAGINGLEPEAGKVVEEIETGIKENPDMISDWYSVLGYAYESLGREKEAEKTYQAGIEKGCIRCYGDLAFLYLGKGLKDEYRETMMKGMDAGCGLCFLLDCDYPEEEFETLPPYKQQIVKSYVQKRLEDGLKQGEESCAYWLGLNYYYGYVGFESDGKRCGYYLDIGMAMGDANCYSLAADILESVEPSAEDKKDAAKFRLEALRRGNESVLSKLILAYRRGLLKEYEDEIEKYWLPDDYDDYEEDDSRWDPYV
ncbi:MAG: hypothetical protein K6F21_03530 [Bacteroidales bacterium]|nr:hypothetical protein [Bacteroidales bacterium]